MQALFYKGEDVTLIFQSAANLSAYTKSVKFFTPLSAIKTATVTGIDNNSFSAKLAAADTADLTAGTLNIVIEFTASGNKTISKTIECKLADPYLDGGTRPANEVNADIVFIGDIAVNVNFSLTNDVAQQVFSARDQVVANSEILGGIAHNASAPTPAKSGRFYFTTGGSCSWITGGAVTVAAGDQVIVVYTAPSTYAYTHVVRGDIAQTTGNGAGAILSQKAVETFYLNKNDARIPGLPISFSVISNNYISSTTGEPVSNTGSKHSDYIDISAFKKIKINSDAFPGGQFRAVVFYNEAKDTKYKPLKLDGSESSTYTMRDSANNITNNGECLVPDGAKWVRFTIQAIAVIDNTYIVGFDKLNDLMLGTFKKQAAKDYTLGYTVKENYHISTVGALVQNTGAKMTVIDVRGYDKLIITGDKPVAANDVRGCAFYGNGALIKPLRPDGQTCSNYSMQDNSGNYIYQGDMLVPSGAEYLAISINFDNGASALVVKGYNNSRLRDGISVEENTAKLLKDSFVYSHNKRVELAYTRTNGQYVDTTTGNIASAADTAITNQIPVAGYKYLFLEAEEPTMGTAIVKMTRGIVFYANDGSTKIKPIADNGAESAGYYLQDTLYNNRYQGLIRVPDNAVYVQMTIQYGNYVNNFRVFGGELALDKAKSEPADFITKQYIQFQINTKFAQDFTGNELVVKDAENMDTDYGVLMLPTSYTKTGEPTRLAIFCHGGGGTVGKTYLGYMFSLAEEQIFVKYLVNQGYAVMDVGGLPKQFAYDNGLDWYRVGGSPMAVQAYEKAYKYIADTYNIRKDGVILTGGSNGALTGMNIAQYSSIPIRTIGFYAPLISMQNLWNIPSGKSWNDAHGLNSFGDLPAGLFTQYQNRANIIKLYGLGSPTTQEQVDAWVYDDTKFKAFDPSQQGVITDNSGNKCKVFKYPIKLWVSTNDPVIDETAVSDLVTMINRAGGYAILRTIASYSHDPQLEGTPVGTFTYNGQTLNIYPVVQELLFWFNRYK